MTQADLGHRERKKLRTREAIVDTANRLFDARGFDATTIADIAAAADIAPRTFFAYFPSKEDVVFHDFDETLAGFAGRLADRDEDESAMDAMRAWIARLAATRDLDDERMQCRARIIGATPELQAHDRVLRSRFEEVLAGAVAQDLDAEPDALRPVLIAAAATAVLWKLGDVAKDPQRGGRSGFGQDDPLAVIDEALAFLRGGIAALQDRPTAER